MEETENTHGIAVETKGNGSQVFNEPYSAEAMERLKEMIINFYNQGEKKFYSIHVDGETVVPRNCDGRKFNRYLPFLSQHSKKVEVKLYSGYSPKCNRYVFYLHKALSGVPQGDVNVKEEIDKALREERLKTELEQLRTEVEKKTKKLKKLKKEVEEAPTWPETLKGFVKMGVNAYSSIKGAGQPPAGMHGAPQQPQAEVEVEAEEDEEAYQSKELFNSLHEKYGEEDMLTAIGWLSVLAAHPQLQKTLKKEVERINEKKEEEDGKNEV